MRRRRAGAAGARDQQPDRQRRQVQPRRRARRDRRSHGGELTVRDHGPGISAADLPHVFDRFYRGAEARGRPGSGLGLAIVRQVADQQGGRSTPRRAPGGGTLMRLPRARREHRARRGRVACAERHAARARAGATQPARRRRRPPSSPAPSARAPELRARGARLLAKSRRRDPVPTPEHRARSTAPGCSRRAARRRARQSSAARRAAARRPTADARAGPRESSARRTAHTPAGFAAVSSTARRATAASVSRLR